MSPNSWWHVTWKIAFEKTTASSASCKVLTLYADLRCPGCVLCISLSTPGQNPSIALYRSSQEYAGFTAQRRISTWNTWARRGSAPRTGNLC